MAPEEDRYFLKSLAKGMQLLTTLAEAGEPLGLTELSRRAGTNSATATRICHTLSLLGFVSRDSRRCFHLTPRLLSLGYASMKGQGWPRVAGHYLEKLAEASGETVNLSVLQGRELVYMVRINKSGRSILPFELQLGSRLPLHCTAMGKSLLAFLPGGELDELLEGYDFARLTHRTIGGREEFLQELARVRQAGYSLNDEEYSVGLRSVAAPVKNGEGRAMAAINLAVPTHRAGLERLKRDLAPLVLRTAREIGRALGAADSAWDRDILADI